VSKIVRKNSPALARTPEISVMIERIRFAREPFVRPYMRPSWRAKWIANSVPTKERAVTVPPAMKNGFRRNAPMSDINLHTTRLHMRNKQTNNYAGDKPESREEGRTYATSGFFCLGKCGRPRATQYIRRINKVRNHVVPLIKGKR